MGTAPHTPSHKAGYTSSKAATNSRDVIWMANGSSDASRAAYRAGALVGFTALNTRPPDDVSIEFVDYPFKRVERRDRLTADDVFPKYLEVVRELEPTYAVIPDIDDELTVEQAYEYAYELEPYCETLIVAPKSIHPSRIPDHLRVGIPCQQKFSEAPWSIDDYRMVDELHLFGGSPHKHFEIIFEHGLDHVESMDTSVPLTSARFGDTWVVKNGSPKWIGGEGGTYGCIEQSFGAMCTVFNQDRPSRTHPENRYWIERPSRGRYETCGYPENSLLHPLDDMPFPGREYHETVCKPYSP